MGYIGRLMGLAILGLCIGVAFAIVSLLVYVVAGGIETVDGTPIGLMTVMAVQIVGGLAGGILAGAFNFLRRWVWGAAILGVLGVLPCCLLVSRVFYGAAFGSAESVSGLVVIAVLLGASLGIYARQELPSVFPGGAGDD